MFDADQQVKVGSATGPIYPRILAESQAGLTLRCELFSAGELAYLR